MSFTRVIVSSYEMNRRTSDEARLRYVHLMLWAGLVT